MLGNAWSGTGYITNVEISVDGGENWKQAAIQPVYENPYIWVFWTYSWVVNQKGEYTIMSRATDSFGFVQPAEARWNRLGYGYNAYSSVYIKVD